MLPASPFRRYTIDQRAYIYSRVVVFCLLTAIYFFGIISPEDIISSGIYLIALGLLGLDTVVFLILVMKVGVLFEHAMMWVLPADLIMVVLFTYLGKQDDSFYPVCILIAVIFALLVPRWQARVVGIATGVAYLTGYLLARTTTVMPPVEYVPVAFAALAIPLTGAIIGNSLAKQHERELEVEHVAAQREELNHQLSRRVAELQAVSQVTEIVHSSLEFDRVGSVVLDIVAKAIDIEPCCLFVIDKEHSETLFSASVGMESQPHDPLAHENVDNHLSCMSVFDHGDMIVLFCADAERIERLSAEDKLVLGAVASELVVAVENSRLYRLTAHLAITDELTDLFNYRYLQQRLDEEVVRAKRYDKQVSLLMLDIDDFKRFNDSQGHIAGDVALTELGAILRDSVREVDVAARYGGEEFSVILPETDGSGAYVVAEKIREAVSEHLFADAGGERVCNLTVSIGVASLPTHGQDKESLLREADDAVYDAKRGGKNRVRTPARHVIPASESEPPDEATGV